MGRKCKKLEASGIEIDEDVMELDRVREKLRWAAVQLKYSKEELKKGSWELKEAREKHRKDNIELWKVRN